MRYTLPILAPLALLGAARASDFLAVETIFPTPGGLNDNYGIAVAVAGDWLFAARPDIPTLDPGAVDAYRRVDGVWALTQTLFASLPDSGAFGRLLDVEGNELVVVAENSVTVELYVFENVGGAWLEVARLEPDTPIAFCNPTFDADLDLDGDRIVLGTARAVSGCNQGTVNVFERGPSGWGSATSTEIPNPSPVTSAFWGRGVALEGDLLAIGHPFSPDFALEGRVDVYERTGSTWTPIGTVPNPDPEAGDRFGYAVDFEGDVLAVGTPLENGTGAVDLFQASGGTFTFVQRVASTNPNTDWFGSAVALDGDRLAVGAYAEGLGGNRGAAYVHTHDGSSWIERERIVPSDAIAGMSFGWSIDIDGQTLTAGAPFYGSTGRAYAYELLSASPIAYCTAKPTSSGCVPAVSWSGLPSWTGPDDFVVLGQGVPAQKTGLFFWGRNGPAALPFLGGTLCVLPPLERTLPQPALGQGPCGAAYSFAITQAWMLAEGLAPCDGIHGQWWLRDPQNPDGTGVALSEGIEITIGP